MSFYFPNFQNIILNMFSLIPISPQIKKMLFDNKNLILYGLIGGSCAALDFILYSIFVIIGMNILLANVIGVHVGIVTSFFLNSRYNFRMTDHPFKRFLSFYIIGLIGLGVSSLLLWLLVDHMGWNPIIAKILAIGIVAICQFLMNKTITFKPTER